mmetsp:Transcript_3131/g.9132  ORF Transcript_3131/g.9132 Transcript_3131/m.9132 type:complete len:86 (+) Transcript_3131:690-947(+)
MSLPKRENGTAIWLQMFLETRLEMCPVRLEVWFVARLVVRLPIQLLMTLVMRFARCLAVLAELEFPWYSATLCHRLSSHHKVPSA